MKITNLFALILFTTSFLNGQSPLHLWEIQGNSQQSPYLNQTVTTTENIITAIVFDGFFVQTPDNEADQDRFTSNGLKMTTNTRPSGFNIGDLIGVTGQVRETNGMTQLAGNLTYNLVSSNNPLPTPATLDDTFPATEIKETPDLEHVEGMIVNFDAIVNSPSNWENIIALTTQPTRSFREPGILYPGLPNLPVWDGNPETFWFDPDGIDQNNNRFLGGGMRIQSEAVMIQSGLRYIALPKSYQIEGVGSVRPVRAKENGEITVGSLNMLQLRSSTNDFGDRVLKMSMFIKEVMGLPDVLAVQEIGNENTLNILANTINQDNSLPFQYSTFFMPGNDGIHVAFLVNNNFTAAFLTQYSQSTQLSTGGTLHDRPPLKLTVTTPTDPPVDLSIINLHLRSRVDIEDAERSNFVRRKRYEQSLDVAEVIQENQNDNLIVVGDFNAFEFTDGYVDVVNQIQGTTSIGAEYQLKNIVDPPLFNHTAALPQEERYSFIFQGYAELIDHCLSNDLPDFTLSEVVFARGNADNPNAYESNPNIPHRSSDHDGFVVYLKPDGTTSLNQVAIQNPVELLSANPTGAGGKVLLRFNNPFEGAVAVFTGMGQMVTSQVNFVGNKQMSIKLPDHLPAGQYWITFFDDRKKWAFPIQVQ